MKQLKLGDSKWDRTDVVWGGYCCYSAEKDPHDPNAIIGMQGQQGLPFGAGGNDLQSLEEAASWVRQHVQACNAGGPCAKKNILAILPLSHWWAGQPQWFPPDQ